MIKPDQFCMDFFKDIMAAEPLGRKAIVLGYTRTLELILEDATGLGKDEQTPN